MDVKNFVRDGLRRVVFDDDQKLAEAKSVEDWWNMMPGKKRAKVVDILGMSKGKNNSVFSKLDSNEQEEISAYFNKHKGKVEDSSGMTEEDDVDAAIEATGKWVDELEKLSSELLNLSSVVRRTEKGKTELGNIKKHIKDLNFESARLMRALSKRS